MARGNRRSGPQRPMPGFRPGKEPPKLRKQRAMQQLGGEVSGSQQRLMELFADRTPQEARALIRRWWVGLLAAAILLAVLGGVLYLWSTVAGILVHVVAGGVLFLWWQVHRKRGDLEAVADMVSGGKTGGGSHGSRRRRK
jgi:Flp pilus assembly protein TadB